MNVETPRAGLLWCGVINCAIRVLWVALVVLAPGYFHWIRRWLRLSAEQLDAIQYGGIVPYKLAILLFNLVPYIALRVVG